MLISIIPVIVQTILQVSEEGMHGRCEEDQGGRENDGHKGVKVSKVILGVVHYVDVIPYMMVLTGRLNMHDNDLITGLQVQKRRWEEDFVEKQEQSEGCCEDHR